MVRERYRTALIGLGRIADTIDDEVVGSGWFVPFSHMGSYMDVPEVQVVGGADLHPQQRAWFGERWGMDPAHLYESYEEMLERERPDIVSVCTSAAPRAKVVLDIARMVRAGRTSVKCLWVEKPIANSLADADAHGRRLPRGRHRPADERHARLRRLLPPGASTH